MFYFWYLWWYKQFFNYRNYSNGDAFTALTLPLLHWRCFFVIFFWLLTMTQPFVNTHGEIINICTGIHIIYKAQILLSCPIKCYVTIFVGIKFCSIFSKDKYSAINCVYCTCNNSWNIYSRTFKFIFQHGDFISLPSKLCM